MKTYNLIWKDEVIDSFETLEEATKMLEEYKLAYHDTAITIEEVEAQEE